MAAVEGSLGFLPRRILVDGDEEGRARRLIVEAGLGKELRDALSRRPELESAAIADGLTEDRWLGGRLVLVQPKRGHRVGTDAALLVAAAGDARQGRIVDVGAGVGAVGLALARALAARVRRSGRDRSRAGAARREQRGAQRTSGAHARLAARRAQPEGAPRGRARRRIGRLRRHQPAVLRRQGGSRLSRRRQSASACLGRGGGGRDARRLDSGFARDSRAGRTVRDDPPARRARAPILAAIGGRLGALALLPVHPRSARARIVCSSRA